MGSRGTVNRRRRAAPSSSRCKPKLSSSPIRCAPAPARLPKKTCDVPVARCRQRATMSFGSFLATSSLTCFTAAAAVTEGLPQTHTAMVAQVGLVVVAVVAVAAGREHVAHVVTGHGLQAVTKPPGHVVTSHGLRAVKTPPGHTVRGCARTCHTVQ